MKNYYEILEVDKNASQEVIDKAYRTLAKKYHPDLQQVDMKQEYAEKMKIINQAYDVLSKEDQRQQYNQQLEEESIRQKQEQERIMRENYELKQRLNRNQVINRNINVNEKANVNNTQSVDEGTLRNMSRVLNEEIQAARQKAYYDAYIQDMRNRGYRIRYKHGFKFYFKRFLTLIIMVGIFFLIYQIPPVKNYFAQLYEENNIFRAIIDIVKNTLSVSFVNGERL